MVENLDGRMARKLAQYTYTLQSPIKLYLFLFLPSLGFQEHNLQYTYLILKLYWSTFLMVEMFNVLIF